MSKSEYAKQMKEVYGEIYKDYYEFKGNVVRQSRNFILKNLERMGVSVSNSGKYRLADMNVLNVGTGRETYVFYTLGAKKIFHFDISDKSVFALMNLIKQRKIDNIYTKQCDICVKGNMNIDDKIDLVYMHGVLHHLRDPDTALRNIFETLNDRCMIYQSIYRSGSFVFFIVDFIRKYVKYEQMDAVRNVFRKKFSRLENDQMQGKSSGDVNRERFHSLYSCVWDDFFIPTVGLIDAKQLTDYFEKSGFEAFDASDRYFTPYNHKDSGIEFQSPLFFFKREMNVGSSKPLGSFPEFIDQMYYIKYDEPYINETIHLMETFLDKTKSIPLEKRIDVALDLYSFAQTEITGVPDIAKYRHHRVQTILRKVLKQPR